MSASGLGKHVALVTRHIRNLRGGSQPILAEASDGCVYVVKFADNLQGPHLPFNESMGTELYRACGLPVAPWRPLLVTDSFLERNPACYLETPEGRRKRASGLCFGSRYLGGKNQRAFEVLPGAFFQRVRNAEDFWRAWLVDICAGHSDNRQAIFREEADRQLEAVFVDFGHMFGGAAGSDPNRPFRVSRYQDGRIYPPISMNFLKKVRGITDNLEMDRLWRQLGALPEEWKRKSAIENFTRCLDRLSSVSILEDTWRAITESHRVITCEKPRPHGRRKSSDTILHPGVHAQPSERRAVAC